VELWLSFLYASYNGAMVVFLTELMPREVRASGFSLAYSMATALGGFTPFICTWLIEKTGNQAIPGVWLSFAAAAGLIAALITRVRRQPHIPHDRVEQQVGAAPDLS
jgi:MFS family permease